MIRWELENFAQKKIVQGELGSDCKISTNRFYIPKFKEKNKYSKSDLTYKLRIFVFGELTYEYEIIFNFLEEKLELIFPGINSDKIVRLPETISTIWYLNNDKQLFFIDIIKSYIFDQTLNFYVKIKHPE